MTINSATATRRRNALANEARHLLRLADYLPKRISLYTDIEAEKARRVGSMYHLLYATYDQSGDATPNYESISRAMYQELAGNCEQGERDLEEYHDCGYWTNYVTKSVLAHLRELVLVILPASTQQLYEKLSTLPKKLQLGKYVNYHADPVAEKGDDPHSLFYVEQRGYPDEGTKRLQISQSQWNFFKFPVGPMYNHLYFTNGEDTGIYCTRKDLKNQLLTR